MGPIVGFREFLSMLRRRSVLIAVVLSAGIVLTLAYATSRPHSYQAITLVQIQPSPLNGSVSDGPGDIAARFRLTEQRIMSRQNITEMIERYDLFQDLPLTQAERVNLFRESATITLIPARSGGGGPESGTSGLFVTVRLEDPAKAARLANNIADQIVSDNRDSVRTRLSELTAVLETDDTRLRAHLAELLNEAAAIRRDAGESLPENLEALQVRLTTLESLRTEATRTQQQLEREKLAIEVASPSSSDAAEGPATIAGRIGELRVALSRATVELGAGHPEVERLRQQMEQLRAGTVPALPSGAIRQMELISQQLDDVSEERRRLETAIAETRTAITRAPAWGERLDAVENRRSVLEAEREALAVRLADARLSESLETRNQGNRMEILERALPPDAPLSSSRRRTAILGVAASIGGSLLAAVMLELLNPVIRSPRQLQAAFGATAIATAPRRFTIGEQASMVVSMLLALAILTAGFVLSLRLVYPDLFAPMPIWTASLEGLLPAGWSGGPEGRSP